MPGDGQSVSVNTAPQPAPYITVGQRQVNVRMAPYHATGDGQTSDYLQIQQAINDGGQGAEIVFPPGIYNLAGNKLFGQLFQKWSGKFQFGIAASAQPPGTGLVQLVWGATLAGSDAIQVGVNQEMEGLCLVGAGNAITTGSAVMIGDGVHSNHTRFNRCQFINFGRGFTSPSSTGFYIEAKECEFNRCALGAYIDGAFNITFIDCYFRPDPVALGVCVEFINGVRNARFIGGSLESFSPSGGIILASNGSGLFLAGVYFESSSAGSLAYGVDNRASGNTIEATGCLVYLSEINRWINCSGLDHTTLVGKGNHFVANVSSNPSPVAYMLPANGTDGFVDLGPDNFQDVLVNLPGALYTSSLSGTVLKNARIVVPSQFATTTGRSELHGRPIWMTQQTADPQPVGGSLAMADKTNWNPAGRINGNPYPVYWDSSVWRPLFDNAEISADRGDNSVTLTVGTDAQQQRFATAFTANRTITLSTTGARNGDKFRIIRSNTAAFTLDVGGLKTLPAGTASWADVVYDSNGGVWRLAADGTL